MIWQNVFLAIFLVFLVSCGKSSDGRHSGQRPTPAEAENLKLQELSSCINCGGAGYQYNPKLCKVGEKCIGVTISIGAAPVTVASCQRTFLDSEAGEHSYACRAQKTN